jgi:polysaccharide pyruvyl transferase WcaK-like protein
LRAQLPNNRVRIIESELSARDLKGLIREAEMLVSERIHAMIGATGVHTPFCCLGSQTDTRVRGIIGNMLKLENVIYYLNIPREKELFIHFDKVWTRRLEIREHLEKVYVALECRLKEAGEQMRTKMGMKIAKPFESIR